MFLSFCVSFCVSECVNVCFVCQCAGGCKCAFVRFSVCENVCKFVPLRALLRMIVYILRRIQIISQVRRLFETKKIKNLVKIKTLSFTSFLIRKRYNLILKKILQVV